MLCPRCGFDSPEGMTFCGECGIALKNRCPQCDIENPPQFKFCGACGTSLATSAPIRSHFPRRPRGAEGETQLYMLLRAVTALLRQERRVTYRELKHIFGCDDACLDALREELRLKQLAMDEAGKVLVWTGETRPAEPYQTTTPGQPVSADTTNISASAISTSVPSVTETRTPFTGSPLAGAVSPEAWSADPSVPSEPIRTTPEAERRQLTVMFCDLADSTKLSQQLDPEDLREVVRAYQGTATEVIHQYEGHIAQYLGDGLLIYFGWPVAHEDDAQRALYAGLGIVKAVNTELNARLVAEQGVQLTVRLGVHSGPVVVGAMGSGSRHENLATGETVNIAARLEGLAAPNTVVISATTARLVRGAFALEELGSQILKGITEPMGLFRVLNSRDVERDKERSLPDGGVSLVGRDEEIGLLLRRWQQSKAGLGQVVLISAEVGLGKSALVDVLRAQVRNEGLSCIAFYCSPYHSNSAFYPIIDYVQWSLKWQPDDTAITKLAKLEQRLAATSLALQTAVPLLAALLSLPLPTDRYAASLLSPQQQRQQTQDVLVAWLLEEAERCPTLAVWEDLHWADASTLETLALFVEQAPTASMLHVLAFRPEFIPPWPTRSHMTPMTLNRLERPQVEAFITQLARGKVLPAEVVEHLVGKTDGVPLYVEELTKMLLESDLLREDTERYVLTGPLTPVLIPDTLQGSLMARLDQLHTAKEVAQLGAALGREFSYDLLHAISSQDEETLRAGLARLVAAELLYQRGRPPQAKYIFKHALIQDVAYGSLLRSTRQQVHQQIARQLETRFPDTVEAHPELLAHHYTEAGLVESAIPYWQQAGQYAMQRSAYIEAEKHLHTGLTLLRALPETSGWAQQALDLHRMLADTQRVIRGSTAPAVGEGYAP